MMRRPPQVTLRGGVGNPFWGPDPELVIGGTPSTARGEGRGQMLAWPTDTTCGGGRENGIGGGAANEQTTAIYP